MNIEKKTLQTLIYESLDKDIERETLGGDEKNQKFKTLLRKDEQDCFCLVEDTSIKCVFEENNLKEYLNGLPSYLRFENFEGKFFFYIGTQIFLKKYKFDYLIIKLSEDNNAIRVVCYIEDFEIDSTQKTSSEIIPININNDETVKNKLQSIIHLFEKVL
jgi:hypothetical protein